MFSIIFCIFVLIKLVCMLTFLSTPSLFDFTFVPIVFCYLILSWFYLFGVFECLKGALNEMYYYCYYYCYLLSINSNALFRPEQCRLKVESDEISHGICKMTLVR